MNSFTDFRLKSWEMMKSYHSFHSLRAVNTWSHSWTICCRRKTDMNLIKSWLGDFSWILGKKSVMDHHTVLRRHIQTLRTGGCSLIRWGHHYIPEDRLLFFTWMSLETHQGTLKQCTQSGVQIWEDKKWIRFCFLCRDAATAKKVINAKLNATE